MGYQGKELLSMPREPKQTGASHIHTKANSELANEYEAVKHKRLYFRRSIADVVRNYHGYFFFKRRRSAQGDWAKADLGNDMGSDMSSFPARR